ncbi:MAG: LysR family transcriptional regulator [Desulfovibrionaceae bacterium]|nr:LysR family transcriptional regulator [Desulfovibrionaceae bacterium]
MELRVLRYFLAVVQEETISGAAEAVHVTQPTLSRQMMELEEELGKTLFVRGKRKISLTEEGMFLRKRAQEIIALVDKTTSAFSAPAEELAGDIYIGGGETEAMRLVARAACRMRSVHPHVVFHMFSGNAEDVMERIDRGLVDFAVFVDPVDLSRFDFLRLGLRDAWGVLMRRDCPLAARDSVRPEDLLGLPLLVSRQSMVGNEISGWMGGRAGELQIVGSYNLLYNASLMVEEGVGSALCLDRIIRISEGSPLCFRPLEPKIEVGLHVAWKKYQIFSRPAEVFLDFLKSEIAGPGERA